MSIEVKDAVKIAKKYIADLYEGELVSEIGLEEVRRDDEKNHWIVTIGFFRSLDEDASKGVFRQRNRLFKQVVIDDGRFLEDAKVLAVNNYEHSY